MGICNSSTKEDVKRDRERTRPGQNSQHDQAGGERQRGASTQIPKPAAGAGGVGMPPGSYRDANGIPRSFAHDAPIASSYKPGSSVGSGAGSGAYGTSYTNRKTKEYDLLNEIVKQTRNNFIDVSAKSGQLDEDDLLERGQKYVSRLSEIPSSGQALAPSAASQSFGVYYSALDLPLPSSLVVKRAPAATSGLSSALTANLAQSRLTGEVDYTALLAIMTQATLPQQDIEFITNASSQVATCINQSTTVQDPLPKIVLTFEELNQER